ncbi:uncharacterized protein [Ptychodera flava]|uniref:uncharacterized protein n=1 Tax=Ptychodera flava TaxID=63121 RepID=UPI00396A01B0
METGPYIILRPANIPDVPIQINALIYSHIEALYSSKCGFNEILDLNHLDIGLITFKPSGTLRCEWDVNVPKGKVLDIIVQYNNVVGDCDQPRCAVDYLEIYDTKHDTHDKLANVCGDITEPPEILYTSGSSLHAHVTKDMLYLQNLFQLVILPRDILQCPDSIGRTHIDHGYFIERHGPQVIIDKTLKLPCGGKIRQWRLNMPWTDGTSVTVYPGIYRRESSDEFTLIGQNDITLENTTSGETVIDIPQEDMLIFQPGDFIGKLRLVGQRKTFFLW